MRQIVAGHMKREKAACGGLDFFSMQRHCWTICAACFRT